MRRLTRVYVVLTRVYIDVSSTTKQVDPARALVGLGSVVQRA